VTPHAEASLADSEAAFNVQGFAVVREFYDIEKEIEPIRHGIYEIIGLIAAAHEIALNRPPYSSETFDAGYLDLKRANRHLAGFVYDGVKQLTAFVRLTAVQKNDALFRRLRGGNAVGVAGGGSGIRIDNPDESRFRAWWHQEYPAQGRSVRGCVFWSPLRSLTPELGPIEICAGSHLGGLIPVIADDGGEGRAGAYAMRLVDEQSVVNRYAVTAPLCEPGDLVVLDFLTIHRSGINVASVPRWTMQFRYFDFAELTGGVRGWAGPAGNERG
jgi:hypothetical protein